MIDSRREKAEGVCSEGMRLMHSKRRQALFASAFLTKSPSSACVFACRLSVLCPG